eukprot:CAMPEP_0204894574 /NCGR_PEP_ID=MMETSP1349-20130617/33498_1 /ASSEMBLY_ACC=CAM_ASM_000710 /TAXON_ID=215587 /ORGANISM="Aplanochytrium stocchinoi, Strain GSBS06" /LENGTH=36 /DNA_ID= /DNA_START= /DNA_END= /DNA_ORIENTATION=
MSNDNDDWDWIITPFTGNYTDLEQVLTFVAVNTGEV